jgi:micrococcal nuclease
MIFIMFNLFDLAFPIFEAINSDTKTLKRIFILFILLAFNVMGYSQTYKGKITEVIDGDTYFFQTASEKLKVRMFGIDAPEGNQPFGKESKDFISKYMHKEATLVSHGHDEYKRTLGTLFIDGQDINLLSVKEGYAWLYKRYLHDNQYAAAQENARKNKLGLWALPNPIQPWTWRQDERKHGINPHNKSNK